MGRPRNPRLLPQEKVVATVTVWGAAAMDVPKRQSIARWLRGQADALEGPTGETPAYRKSYTARYIDIDN